MAAAQPLKIRMVAGLGNPGEEYAETRHNAGFKAIDELARQAGVTYWKNQAGAEIARININDPEEEGGKRQIVLVKPQSYMNTSGGPISKLCREYKIKAEELLVIHDELDIPAGDVRVKVGGVTKFACVDGPDFDATLVDWDDLRARQAAYRSEEGESLKAYEEKSCACH